MLKKYITYTDFNGRERKEAFYFNISKAELIEMEYTSASGMEDLLQSIIDSKDNIKLFNLFKELIHRSYGVKSEDGRRFIKSKEISDAFMQTEAYTNLLIELMGDNSAQNVADFIKGIMPLEGISSAEVDKAFEQATKKVEEAYPESVVAEAKTVPFMTGE